MIADCIENESDALRELARWILRDGIDCDHLEDYMRALLSNHLVEPHASCRYGAMKAIKCCAGLGAVDVAGYLCEIALQIEQENSAFGLSRIHNYSQNLPPDRSTERRLEPARKETPDVSLIASRLYWLPELIAAVAFMTVGCLLIPTECGDVTLRILAASIYALVGVTHAGVAIHSAWQHAHPTRWNL